MIHLDHPSPLASYHPKHPASPHHSSVVSRPVSPSAADTAAPSSSPLSAPPEATSPHNDAKAAAIASRQSTPLSELSPAPDDDEPEPDVKNEESKSGSSPTESSQGHPNGSSTHPSPLNRDTPSLDLLTTTTSRPSNAPPDTKIILVLDINSELLKVCMEFQAHGIAPTDQRYVHYANRLQTNLTWLAGAADSRNSGINLPSLEAPPPNDFVPLTRLQELYSELAPHFAKEVARHQQMQSLSSNPSFNNLKRERPDDGHPDGMNINKRRDTGESKAMMPPPAVMPGMARGDSFSNGAPHLPPNTLSDPGSASPGTGENQMMTRTRQAQMRQLQQQQQRQMSPQSVNGSGPMQPNQVAGPSSTPSNPQRLTPQQISSLPPPYQAAYQLLQTPSHPFLQRISDNTPGFWQLPIQQQLQRILTAQQQLKAQQQQQQQQHQQINQHGGMGGSMVGGFQGQASPLSPQGQGSMGMDPRGMGSPPLGGMMSNGMGVNGMSGGIPGGGSMSGNMGGGGGGMSAAGNMNAMNQQFVLMQQQRNQSGFGVGMGMSAQQQHAFQQQQQGGMRQSQRPNPPHEGGQDWGGPGEDPRRFGVHQQDSFFPSQIGSPQLSGPEFPALRSNAIPAISRATRSPSDGASSPITPRIPSSQQQRPNQNQFNQMNRPASAGFGAPSPTSGAQNWGVARGIGGNGGMGGGYPFDNSSGAMDMNSRHMSGTPGPQHLQNTPSMDLPIPSDIDFNWPQ